MLLKNACITGGIFIALTLSTITSTSQISFDLSSEFQKSKTSIEPSIKYRYGNLELGTGLIFSSGEYKIAADFSKSKFIPSGEEIPNIPIFVINPNQELYYGSAKNATYDYKAIGGQITSYLKILDFSTTGIPLSIKINNSLGGQQVIENYNINYESTVRGTKQNNSGSRTYSSLFFTSGISASLQLTPNLSVSTSGNVAFNKPLLNTDYEVDLNSPYAGNVYGVSVGIKYDLFQNKKPYSCISF